MDFTKSDAAVISQYRKFGKGVAAVLNNAHFSAWLSWLESLHFFLGIRCQAGGRGRETTHHGGN